MPGLWLYVVSLHPKAQGRYALEGEWMHMAVCMFVATEEMQSVQQRLLLYVDQK